MSDEGGRRPRRAASKAAERTFQKASVTAQVPSAMHYVGYVEEDETPEMIAEDPSENGTSPRSPEELPDAQPFEPPPPDSTDDNHSIAEDAFMPMELSLIHI